MTPPSESSPDVHAGQGPTRARSAEPRGRIARQIAAGFGLVAAVSVAMCAMLFSVIAQVAGLVGEMRHHEGAIDRSHELATAVREQYAHQAHTLIEGDGSHLEHYGDWIQRASDAIASLRPVVPQAEQRRLDLVQSGSRTLDEIFRGQMLPAVQQDDRVALARIHREADRIAQAAAEQADAVAQVVESGMVHAHISATRATRLGFAMSAFCVLLILGLSIGYTMRLRQAVLKPLAAIADSARKVGAGDFSARVGAIGQGELRDVADAFDRMLEEISAREQRLLQAERMAAIGQLAAGVAHEINNPIGIIRGYLKTMGPDSPPQVLREELRILDEEAAACQRIAEDLLAYARPPDLRIESTAIDELIREVVRRFDDTRTRKHNPIVVTAEPTLISVDPGRVRQVLLNLLRNAANAAPAESTIDVVGVALGAGAYDIAVSDRGPGVKPDDRARIFEPFFSGSTDGSGLGLAVSQGIVRAHGGTIEVDDRPEGGATFRVRLPGAANPRALTDVVKGAEA